MKQNPGNKHVRPDQCEMALDTDMIQPTEQIFERLTFANGWSANKDMTPERHANTLEKISHTKKSTRL